MFDVIVSIEGHQYYEDQEPDVIKMVADGTLTKLDDGWEIAYDESALNGMEGVHTCFRIHKGKIILTRTGKLRSEMVFEVGVLHESLYTMDFGSLLIGVCGISVDDSLTEEGGSVELSYRISIEGGTNGLVEYFLDIKRR